MYDIHSHILPTVDDGATSMDESASILNGFSNLGYSRVVATPHWAVGMLDIPIDIIHATSELASDRGIELLLARECRIHPNLSDHVQRNPLLRINRGNVVLVELPWGSIPNFTVEVFSSLMRAGFRPVLVHPERHAPLWEDDSPLNSLIDLGVLIQMNLQSLIGMHGPNSRNRAISMLEQGKVTVVASDIHSAAELDKNIPGAHELLKDLVGEHVAAILTTSNPLALLEDKPLIDLRSSDIDLMVDKSVIYEEGVLTGLWAKLVGSLPKLGRRTR